MMLRMLRGCGYRTMFPEKSNDGDWRSLSMLRGISNPPLSLTEC